MSFNQVILLGRLGADPEIRASRNGKLIANFSVATSRKTLDGNEVTDWHKVFCGLDYLVNLAQQYLKKGSQVQVVGQLTYSTYTKADGTTAESTSIVAQNIQLCGSSSNSGAGVGGYPNNPQPQYPNNNQQFGNQGNQFGNQAPTHPAQPNAFGGQVGQPPQPQMGQPVGQPPQMGMGAGVPTQPAPPTYPNGNFGNPNPSPHNFTQQSAVANAIGQTVSSLTSVPPNIGLPPSAVGYVPPAPAPNPAPPTNAPHLTVELNPNQVTQPTQKGKKATAPAPAPTPNFGGYGGASPIDDDMPF